MPVWLVFGVQSSASFTVVNGCDVGVLGSEQTVLELTGCFVVEGAVEPETRCCQRKAPTTTIISTTGMAMLVKSRVREFISVYPFDDASGSDQSRPYTPNIHAMLRAIVP